MSDSFVKTINSALQCAGVSQNDLKMVEIKPTGSGGYYNLEIRQDGKTQEKSFTDLDEFYQFLNTWIAENQQLAANRIGNSAKLFEPYGRNWIAVDCDNKKGADAVIYYSDGFSGKGPENDFRFVKVADDPADEDPFLMEQLKKLAKPFINNDAERRELGQILVSERASLGLLEFLSRQSWDGFGIDAPVSAFRGATYVFEAAETESAPPFMSPFHDVHIAGDPEADVPWSDNYLILEWENYLREAGIEIVSSIGYFYEFKNTTIMDRVFDGSKMTYRLYNPLGGVIREKSVDFPLSHDIQVISPDDPSAHDYFVVVNGLKVKIEAYFPADLSKGDREWSLERIGDGLRRIPRMMLLPLIQGRGAERPVRIVFATEEDARKMGLLNGSAGGNYNYGTNTLWIGPYYSKVKGEVTANSQSEETVEHEVGHALADFLVSEDILGRVTEPVHSALKDYYIFKLKQLFSADEIREYDELSTEYRSLQVGMANYNEEAKKRLEELKDALDEYRSKAREKFVSNYAAEGLGLRMQGREPHEDFAEVMQRFFEYVSFKDDNQRWWRERMREPLLRLAGALYLAQNYGVASIGNINREEIFSRRAFKEILGIELSEQDLDEIEPLPVRILMNTPILGLPFKCVWRKFR